MYRKKEITNNDKAPANRLNLFQKTSNTHSYNTQSSTSGKFYVKSCRQEIQNNSSWLKVKLWNKIPCCITDLPKKALKRVIHKLLFDILEKEDDYIQIPMITPFADHLGEKDIHFREV